MYLFNIYIYIYNGPWPYDKPSPGPWAPVVPLSPHGLGLSVVHPPRARIAAHGTGGPVKKIAKFRTISSLLVAIFVDFSNLV